MRSNAELTVLGWSLWGDILVFPRIPLPNHEAFATRYAQLNTYYPGMYSYTYPLQASNSGLLDGYENIQSLQPPGYRLLPGPAALGYCSCEPGTAAGGSCVRPPVPRRCG